MKSTDPPPTTARGVQLAAEYVIRGSHVNTFCVPVFPGDLPEARRA